MPQIQQIAFLPVHFRRNQSPTHIQAVLNIPERFFYHILGTIQAECGQGIFYFVADEDKNAISFPRFVYSILPDGKGTTPFGVSVMMKYFW